MSRRRCKAEAQVLRSSVALMWLGGRTGSEIAKACAISENYVGVLVHALRAEGMDLPRRKKTSPARRRIGVRFSSDRDDVLDAWADGVQARDLALLTRRSVGSVKQIIYRARRSADPRAIPHPRWP